MTQDNVAVGIKNLGSSESGILAYFTYIPKRDVASARSRLVDKFTSPTNHLTMDFTRKFDGVGAFILHSISFASHIYLWSDGMWYEYTFSSREFVPFPEAKGLGFSVEMW